MADEIDWCARVSQLREIEFARVSGGQVSETRFGPDMVRFLEVSDAELQRAIRYAETQCRTANGKRSRYAMAARSRAW